MVLISFAPGPSPPFETRENRNNPRRSLLDIDDVIAVCGLRGEFLPCSSPLLRIGNTGKYGKARVTDSTKIGMSINKWTSSAEYIFLAVPPLYTLEHSKTEILWRVSRLVVVRRDFREVFWKIEDGYILHSKNLIRRIFLFLVLINEIPLLSKWVESRLQFFENWERKFIRAVIISSDQCLYSDFYFSLTFQYLLFFDTILWRNEFFFLEGTWCNLFYCTGILIFNKLTAISRPDL